MGDDEMCRVACDINKGRGRDFINKCFGKPRPVRPGKVLAPGVVVVVCGKCVLAGQPQGAVGSRVVNQRAASSVSHTNSTPPIAFGLEPGLGN
jgi:hypothetical protein